MAKTEKLNTPDVVIAISNQVGCSQRMTRRILDAFSDLVLTNLLEGKQLSLASLGKFYARQTRQGRNPGSTRMAFKATKKVAERLRG
ncbi:HU family DNA-binding protein [Heliorestis convoluta]|uniref:HU family DNA-binding protein n=1 Tax=Heliorestis convoluta TaxID=356322 RepID=A0A5Q2N8P0_9FIRM|nr:HU family DNA-binding protein [Heliorestis convoluta]QGG48865.1 HU family DNA-binding protein [Heliorestis convoluta]